jgi:hypothetical protein
MIRLTFAKGCLLFLRCELGFFATAILVTICANARSLIDADANPRTAVFSQRFHNLLIGNKKLRACAYEDIRLAC